MKKYEICDKVERSRGYVKIGVVCIIIPLALLAFVIIDFLLHAMLRILTAFLDVLYF